MSRKEYSILAFLRSGPEVSIKSFERVIDDIPEAYIRMAEVAKNNFIRCYKIVKFGRANFSRYEKFPPHCDHLEMAEDENGKKYMIYHPYYFPYREHLEKDIEWAESRGLRIDIDRMLSWYYPGKTNLVVISTPEGAPSIGYSWLC